MRIAGLSIRGTIVAAALVAMVAVEPPAYATSVLARIESAVGCATTGACVTGSNTSSGPGVSGTSASGYGVEGVSTSNDGLKGISTSSNGLSASSTSAFGVKGLSSTSYGVYAASKAGGGVLGTTANPGNAKQAGVTGNDLSTDGGIDDGVLGTVTNGAYGVQGISGDNAIGGVAGDASTGTGVSARSTSGDALVGNTLSGTAIFAETVTGHEAAEIFNKSGPDGLVAQGVTTGVVAQGGILALDGIVTARGDPIVLQSATDGQTTTVFYVNASGDVHYAGSLESFSRTASGATMSSFAAKTTRPTVEDTGTAHLGAGTAAVALDPAFAATIDPSSAYRVFITPDGETRGLFVASKSMRGFTVREVQGGRSSVDFDYRIVAIAAGQSGKHMAPVDPATIPNPREPKLHEIAAQARDAR